MARGQLRIFFGYSAGVGKTYAMLKSAQDLKNQGVDVVVGYLEPQERPDTIKMAENLETIPFRLLSYKGVLLKEFDLDAALARHPQLLLVDELAHTNAPGSKNPKRYLDVEDLLKAGIDVFTTVNVQHIEGLHDIVGEATEVDVGERIPDEIFDYADEVTLVDIEPEELLERMKAGKIYKKTNAAIALMNFFSKEKLSSLRELAMRRSADRLEKQAHNGQLRGNVLVLISPSPSSAKNIRVAARMASAFHQGFTALYVESDADMGEEALASLNKNMQLVRDFGGELVTKHSWNLLDTVSDFVPVIGASELIMGKTWRKGVKNQGFEESLIAKMPPNVEILIVPGDETVTKRPHFLALLKSAWGELSFTLRGNETQTKKVLEAISMLSAAARYGGGEAPETRIGIALSQIFRRSCELWLGQETVLSSWEGEDAAFFSNPKEESVAQWGLAHEAKCGHGTGILNDAKAVYFPLFFDQKLLGVVGFSCQARPFGAPEVSLFANVSDLLEFILSHLSSQNGITLKE
jgi:K+-sensing histidine kinase KdpD